MIAARWPLSSYAFHWRTPAEASPALRSPCCGWRQKRYSGRLRQTRRRSTGRLPVRKETAENSSTSLYAHAQTENQKPRAESLEPRASYRSEKAFQFLRQPARKRQQLSRARLMKLQRAGVQKISCQRHRASRSLHMGRRPVYRVAHDGMSERRKMTRIWCVRPVSILICNSVNLPKAESTRFST